MNVDVLWNSFLLGRGPIKEADVADDRVPSCFAAVACVNNENITHLSS